MNRTIRGQLVGGAALCILLVSLAGCETLKALLSIERPTVNVEGAELTGLSFDGAEVTVDLSIDNPNSIGISMSGFSYELEIEGNRFLGGDIDEPIQIDPVASSELQVPVEFGFREVLETITSLREADEAAYAVSFEFRFDVPVLGPVSVPVRAEGRVPIPRLPSIQLGALNLEGITIAGADLRLDLAIRNPNSFGLRIQSLAYEFAVDGNSWVDGSADRPQAVPAGQESVISLPFSIRFLSLGRTVRNVLLGRDALQYALDINAVIAADIGLIPSLDLPVQLSGSVDLSR